MSTSSLIRRRWLVTGGAAAIGAGAGLAVWLRSTAEPEGLWSLAFDRPDGTRLALAELRGAPLLLNFWATWCPPCVREMPALDRFAKAQAARGWRVLGLAVDKAEPVREFLARTPVSYPIALAGFAGIELSRTLGNRGGGLPFTVVFDRRGRVRARHAGEARAEQLDAWAEGNP
ncbi:MAG TPA: TlpA disulfide reductase family protein [Burkholderiaceae bacterium]|nr:TlpA disulfide reductase family protein [Burkholderiaceae bacterium]